MISDYGPDRYEDERPPANWFLQYKAGADAACPWTTFGVFREREEADEAARAVAATGAEVTAHGVAPAAVETRVVSLDDLLREGPQALWCAIWQLSTSDRNHSIETHLPREQRETLYADYVRGDLPVHPETG